MRDITHMLSPAERLAATTAEERREILQSLSIEEKDALPYQWSFWARPAQRLPKGQWSVWLIRTGRGWGKTRAGAEAVRERAEKGLSKRIALVGRTAKDVRDTMLLGPGGLLTISPPDKRPKWEPSKATITWPNGCVATTYSGDKPEQLRGPGCDFAWADEPAHWKYPSEAWANLTLVMREGENPQIVATTTPLPIKLIRDLNANPNVVVTTGSSYENRANLTPKYYEQNVALYEGTRRGRQEIYGEVLEDVPGALFNRSRIDALRVTNPPPLFRIIVAIDPAVTSGETANETGIVCAALGEDMHGYLLDDRSCRISVEGWASRAIQLFHERRADMVVGEVNNGGDLVERNLRVVDPRIPYKSVHASRGKVKRADPIGTLEERGWIHHVGKFDQLEDELCLFTPEGGFVESPNRADAYVWAFTELFVEKWLPAEAEEVTWNERYEISPF